MRPRHALLQTCCSKLLPPPCCRPTQRASLHGRIAVPLLTRGRRLLLWGRGRGRQQVLQRDGRTARGVLEQDLRHTHGMVQGLSVRSCTWLLV